MATVRISRSGDRLVAVKEASADAAELVRSEARVLQALDHPGLIQFVELVEEGDSVVMSTGFAGADTWASQPPELPIERASGIAAIAATIADLHARGIVHGSLRAEHVIRTDDDRPVLCGLSRTRGDGESERQADLEALSDLIEEPPLPPGPVTAELMALAARIRSRRHDASDVVQAANRITATGREASVPDRAQRRRTLAIATMAVIAAGGTAVTAFGGLHRTEGDTARAHETATTSAVPVASAAPPSAASHPQPPPATDGSVVIEHQGRRYRIGYESDIVVLGDWDCDGETTPAVLRPPTGEIGVFERWPDPFDSISAPGAWVIDGAVGLSVEAGTSCDRLRVDTDDGSRILDPGDLR